MIVDVAKPLLYLIAENKKDKRLNKWLEEEYPKIAQRRSQTIISIELYNK